MSRPRRFDDVATIRLSVRVTEQQRHDLERIAVDNQRRMTEVIRDALDEYVTDYRDRVIFERRRRP